MVSSGMGRRLGIANGQCVISDDIDGSNDEIAKMFGASAKEVVLSACLLLHLLYHTRQEDLRSFRIYFPTLYVLAV